MTKLGEGAYGSVVKKGNYAVKKFSKVSHIIQEQAALFYLKDCKYIVQSREVNYHKLELTMDLYDVSLRKWLSTNKSSNYDKIIHDILCGLIELQDRGLSHSDLKPGNILIRKNPLKAVLGDCGFVSIAKYSKQQRTAQSHRDLVVVNDDKHDMFSLGVILLELWYNVKPSVKNSYQDYYRIINKKVQNETHKFLLKNLLNENRASRYNAREVLEILYNKSYKLWKPTDINVQYVIKDVCEKYGKRKLKHYELLLKKNKNNMKINRNRKGYNALLIFLNNHNINLEYIDYYFVSMLIIMDSIFNNRTADIDNILLVCKVKYKKIINDIIYAMTNHTEFINAIYF